MCIVYSITALCEIMQIEMYSILSIVNLFKLYASSRLQRSTQWTNHKLMKFQRPVCEFNEHLIDIDCHGIRMFTIFPDYAFTVH